MALTLTRPMAGQVVTIVASKEELDIALFFPLEDAVFEREGDNLVLSFDAGEKIVLENFYTEYTGENLPDFMVDGVTVEGRDFFEALGDETLMPASGENVAEDGGRFYDYDPAALASGVDALGKVSGGSEYERFGDLDPGEVSGAGAKTDPGTDGENPPDVVNVGAVEYVYTGGTIAHAAVESRSEIPYQPAVSGTPEIPYQSATPGTPEIPYQAAIPGTPEIPYQPAVPGTPEIPYQSATQGTPEIPYQPAVPGTPEIPYQPAVPGTPEIPYQAAVEAKPEVLGVDTITYSKGAVYAGSIVGTNGHHNTTNPTWNTGATIYVDDYSTSKDGYGNNKGFADWDGNANNLLGGNGWLESLTNRADYTLDANNLAGLSTLQDQTGDGNIIIKITGNVIINDALFTILNQASAVIIDGNATIDHPSGMSDAAKFQNLWYINGNLVDTNATGVNGMVIVEGTWTSGSSIHLGSGTGSIAGVEYQPAVPGTPEVPYQPAIPGTPEVPYQPAVPGTPEIPYQPAVPGTPEIPYQPAVPGTPEIPYQPAVPGTPEIPYQPAVPGTPEIPYQPAVPFQPAIPYQPAVEAQDAVDAVASHYTFTISGVDGTIGEVKFLDGVNGSIANGYTVSDPIDNGNGNYTITVTGPAGELSETNFVFNYTVTDSEGNRATATHGFVGDDALYGGHSTDMLYGGAGNDMLIGSHGDDTLYGGAGNDILIGGDASDVSVSHNTIYHLGFNSNGTFKNDLTDLIHFANGVGTNAGNNYLHGGGVGNNILIGGDGHDTLIGGDGNDILYGGGGNNTLTGGAGDDLFVIGQFSGTTSTITDFNNGADILDLTAFHKYDYTVSVNYEPQGATVNITHTDDRSFLQTIHLKGYTGGELVNDGDGHYMDSNSVNQATNDAGSCYLT